MKSQQALTIAARRAAGVLAVAALGACVTPRFDFWGIEYHTEIEGVAVTHMLLKSGDRILDENRQRMPDGTFARYYREGFSGRLPRPTSLHVEWIEEATGAIHDRQIDLDGLLPQDLEDQKLRLVFKGDHVYLFIRHLATDTLGQPVKASPAPQIFPDPKKDAYSGNEQPKTFEQHAN